jgi:hypothetical protein
VTDYGDLKKNDREEDRYAVNQREKAEEECMKHQSFFPLFLIRLCGKFLIP